MTTALSLNYSASHLRNASVTTFVTVVTDTQEGLAA